MTTVSMKDQIAWKQRKGRRESDAEVPNMRQCVRIANSLRTLVSGSKYKAELVKEILPFMSRGDVIAVLLGVELSTALVEEAPDTPSPQ